MSRFDAAKTTLNVSLAQLDYLGEDCDGVKQSMAQIQAAIRLLEAADQVDHDELMWARGHLEDGYAKSVYSLLACLPDQPASQASRQAGD